MVPLYCIDRVLQGDLSAYFVPLSVCRVSSQVKSAYGTAVEVLCFVLVLLIHTVLVKRQSMAKIVIQQSFLFFSSFSFYFSCFYL